ncbi:hypothetical protein FOMPIDRAFT_1137507, partial [Fomitopsis schrenkii]
MQKPHEVTNTSVVNFLYTLTAYDVRAEVVLGASSVVSPTARPIAQVSDPGGENTLVQLVQHCKEMHSYHNAYDFRYMVALMRLSFECASMSGWSNVNLAALWRDHLAGVQDPPKYSTLRYWYSRGTKLAQLAEGGTIYVLLWVAYTNLRAPFLEADGSLASDIANILRCPDSESPIGRLVRETIIPTIAFMVERCPMQLSDILSPAMILAIGVKPSSLCRDLKASDSLFGALPKNSFRLLPRNADAWEPVNIQHNITSPRAESRALLSPLTPLSQLGILSVASPTPSIPNSPPQAGASNHSATTILLESGYDDVHTLNTTFKSPRNREKNVRWTESQRGLAEDAVTPSSIIELRTLLQTMYTEGVRSTTTDYIRIERSLYSDVLRVNSLQSELVACICQSMPQNLRDGLLDRLTACFKPDTIKTLDTATYKGEHVFQVLHFTWYNRHCTMGHDAPVDVPPMTLKRTGRTKTNYHQLIPYPSKDMSNEVGNRSIYQSVKNILGPLFDWLEVKLEEILPGTYEHLEAYARILPGNNQAVGAPFLGLVINLNVVTAAH